MTNRPTWPYKISKKLVKWLMGYSVTKIKYHAHEKDSMHGFISVKWLTFHCKDIFREYKSKSPKVDIELLTDTNELSISRYEFGLIKVRQDIIDKFIEIENWDKKHKEEREQYELLKEKLGK